MITSSKQIQVHQWENHQWTVNEPFINKTTNLKTSVFSEYVMSGDNRRPD